MTHFEASRGITVTRRDIRTGVRALHLSGRPLCVHASLRAFGWVEGGPSAVVESLLAEGCTVMVPTHSYAYHIAPPGGEPSPPRDAPVYTPASQVLDRQYMGAIPYTVLQMPERLRGDHPLDSFTAVGPLATELIASQTAQEVYAPLRVLAGRGGWVLLMGVGLDKLTLLHLAEALAGRPMFQHWALGPDRRPLQVRIGGCSDGFVNLEPALAPLSRACRVGASRWHAYPVRELLDAAADAIRADPWITHCGRPECEECNLAVSSTPKPRA